MCFSAEASFAAGAVLLPAGISCVRSALRNDRRFLPLACSPLLFGAQQCCEGFAWLGIEGDNAPLTRAAALSFLFFALFLWPFWVPFSVALTDPRRGPRRLLTAVALLALVLGWAFYAPLVLDPERLGVRVVHHSIQYDIDALPQFDKAPAAAWQFLYLGSICCPFLISPYRQFRPFALTLAVSGIVSHLAFRHAFESVWCFFAAALSLQLWYAFRELRAPGQDSDAQPLPQSP